MLKLWVKQAQCKGFMIDQAHYFIAGIKLIQKFCHFFGGIKFAEIQTVFAISNAIVLHGGFGNRENPTALYI